MMTQIDVVLLVLGLCGVYVIADGIGSVLTQGGQYHNVVFDGERWIRTLVGLIIVVMAVVAWHLVG